jgi:hypothetical protein
MPDSLHPRLLFEIKESIAEPLRIIFNQSLALETVPKEWKNAKLVQSSRKVINHRQRTIDQLGYPVLVICLSSNSGEVSKPYLC